MAMLTLTSNGDICLNNSYTPQLATSEQVKLQLTVVKSSGQHIVAHQ